jgi:ribonuclease P protein subunit POP4
MMTINGSNLYAHEFIGLKVTISDSPDLTKIGVAGMVRDETKNMLTIQVRDRFLRIPKDGSKFTFDLPVGDKVVVEGSNIQFRPEDRIKRRTAKW